jgi:hypothetical protein
MEQKSQMVIFAADAHSCLTSMDSLLWASSCSKGRSLQGLVKLSPPEMLTQTPPHKPKTAKNLNLKKTKVVELLANCVAATFFQLPHLPRSQEQQKQEQQIP